ncbi:MAG: ASCH domain-containing protein [Myxococcota bacterium]
MTLPQLLAGQKTVTRRIGWRHLRVGQQVLAVDRVMGLKRGESPTILATIEIVAVREEPLDAIDQADCAREGFAQMTPEAFVSLFCSKMRCEPTTRVRRIEFRIVEFADAAFRRLEELKQ